MTQIDIDNKDWNAVRGAHELLHEELMLATLEDNNLEKRKVELTEKRNRIREQIKALERLMEKMNWA